jgi:hypothetical protein
MHNFLQTIDKPFGSVRLEVTDHTCWTGILSAPIEECRIQWCDGDITPTPDAVHLRTATGEVWIAAGRSATYEPDGAFQLGTDDVLVIFDAAIATRAGLGI